MSFVSYIAQGGECVDHCLGEFQSPGMGDYTMPSLFICSFDKCLLNAYHISVHMLDTG